MTQKQIIQMQKNEIDRLKVTIEDLEYNVYNLHIEIHDLRYQYDEQYRKEHDTQSPDDLPF